MQPVTSGVASLDTLVSGGLAAGDNVIWTSDDRALADLVCSAFLREPAERSRLVALRSAIEVPEGIEVITVGRSRSRAGLDELEALLLDPAFGVGDRLVVDGLDEVLTRWGAPATIRLYQRVCPRLFERGVVAYWTGSCEVLGQSVADAVTKVAQCSFDLRRSRLHVVKAEGRPASVQGVVVDVVVDDGAVELTREHMVGRVGEGLRRVRSERNLTQSQLAELAGVTPAAISQAETGRRSLSLATIVPMCEALGIGVDDLLGAKAARDPVLARHDRHGDGGPVVSLFDDPGAGARAYLVRLAAQAEGAPPFAHKGLEMILVARGLVLVDLGSTSPVLRAGDGLTVSTVPVRAWTNLAAEPAELFWIPVG